MPGTRTKPSARAIDDLIVHQRVHALYQPIVRISSREVVAYEALARGPHGSDLESPAAMFAAAASAGRTRELDWECQRAALSGAMHANLGLETRLFVNVEPSALDDDRPPAVAAAFARAEQELGVVLEISERAVLDRPRQLLDVVARARRHGWGIALDDVGVNPASLSLMPLIDPDVIKLDLSIVQEHPTAETGRLLNAVVAQVERSGAQLLAEGIETVAHEDTARSLGATLGQGWLYGRPGPALPRAVAHGRRLPTTPARSVRVPDTPFDLVDEDESALIAPKRLLLAISHDLEDSARRSGDRPVVIGAFQSADRFTVATRRRYEQLAAECTFVGAVGRDLGSEPAPGVRGGALAADDRLIGEWTVVVLSPHTAAALIAREIDDRGPDSERRFAYKITHDRTRVALAARSLLHRIVATG